jgi:putative polyhydroxyalkanoate system protein
MSDIKFQQAHSFGMDKARELATQWIAEATSQLGLSCRHEQGAEEDTVHFERPGVKGVMRVSGQQFDLDVKLGMMMSAFKPVIEAEIRKNLGRLLGK